jgi:anti-anti-sigma factor
MCESLHVIAPSGILDATQGKALRDKFMTTLEGGVKDFRLDMGQITFMDSAGFGALVMILKKVREAGGQLTLTNVQHQVRLVLELTGTDKIFTLL